MILIPRCSRIDAFTCTKLSKYHDNKVTSCYRSRKLRSFTLVFKIVRHVHPLTLLFKIVRDVHPFTLAIKIVRDVHPFTLAIKIVRDVHPLTIVFKIVRDVHPVTGGTSVENFGTILQKVHSRI